MKSSLSDKEKSTMNEADNVIVPSYWTEYTVNVENISFRMLGDMHHHGYNLNSEQKQLIISLNQLHTHTYAEMFVCIAGNIILKTECGTIEVGESDMVIIPAEMKHVKCDDDNGAEWFSISFSCTRRHIRGCQNLFGYYNRLCTAYKPLILRGNQLLCLQAASLTASGTGKPSAVTALALMHLLSEFADLYHADIPAPKQHTTKEESALNRTALLQHIIVTQYVNDLTEQYIAEKLFISTRQLQRIMKKQYGMTLHQTVIDLRLKTAAEMLLTSALSAEEIGRTVGFPSKSGFYREFTKKFGIPPMQYRKQNKTDPS